MMILCRVNISGARGKIGSHLRPLVRLAFISALFTLPTSLLAESGANPVSCPEGFRPVEANNGDSYYHCEGFDPETNQRVIHSVNNEDLGHYMTVCPDGLVMDASGGVSCRGGGSQPQPTCTGLSSPGRGGGDCLEREVIPGAECTNSQGQAGTVDESGQCVADTPAPPGPTPAPGDGPSDEQCQAVALSAGCTQEQLEAREQEIASCRRMEEPTAECQDLLAKIGGGSPPPGPPGPGPGPGPGNNDLEVAQQGARDAIDQCKQAQRAASSCCNNPMKCTLGIDLGAGGALGTAVLGGAAMAVGSGGGDIAKACKTMKMLGYTGAALNGASAAKCHSKKSSCLDVCESSRDWYANQLRTTSMSSPLYETFRQAELQLSQTMVRCEGYAANVDKLAQQAVQNAFSAKMSDLCQKQAEASPEPYEMPDMPKLPVSPHDCSDPANKNSPFCQDPCEKPGAENDPRCRTGVAGVDGSDDKPSAGFDDGSSFGGDGLNEFNVGSTAEGDETVSKLGDEVPIEQTRSGVVPGNGGGFGGGGGGGGVPALPSTGEKAKGANTDILKGVGGGGGYSVSQGGFANTSGFSGYGGGSRAQKERNRSKFDLKKYLPGDDKKGNLRRIAGGEARHPEIGSPHESIWKRVSNRYQVICKLGRLMECGQ